MHSLLSSLALLIPLISAQSSFEPARPPAIPLAVRTPYLSTWQAAGADGGNGGYLAGQWPTFWAGQINGWAGLIRVDDETYTWMGKPDPLPKVVTQTAFEYTSTRSTFTMDVDGKVSMNITFLSPVDPKDKQRQGMPVSYMSVNVQSADGNEHEVAIYTDISAEWTSGDRDQIAEWSRGTASGQGEEQSGSVAYHKVWRQLQQEFSENSDQASWGTWYYVTENDNGLSYQSGSDIDVRKKFVDDGELANSYDTNFRAINRDYPVFAFAKNLGSVGCSNVETVFTINLLQQNSVQFATAVDRVEQVPAFWRASFGDDELSAITTMYYDYQSGAAVSAALDVSVENDARAAGGEDYVAITSLAVRQAFASVQIAGTQDTNYMLLKEISSNGNFQTVDVVFPFHPILLYMNADWMKMLLDPLFINMEAPGLWPQDYAIHDLGDHYPNATGHADSIAALQPLEECGNMLIMTLAYARRTNDIAYLNQHWDSLHKWAQWLISNNSVIPFNQISTDDFAGPLANQTNLALKGIIGLKAASMIANMTGRQDDARDYDSRSRDWIQQWEQLANIPSASPPRTSLNYGDEDSWSLLYNLYADSLLNANLVPKRIYEQQSDFYPTVEQRFGVALDTRASRTKNDWEMFCAAIASTDTREMFLRDLVKFINETPTTGPVTDLYEVDTGNYPNGMMFRARPVVGGWFSLLALDRVGIPE
ncbi:Putative six-hairpin glycosidase superfamily [Septoria linicola]|uniref:Six-hairpin glycosidase superfamily n=1 Tax=Septoria linicola TaxID=215465 RepID=A0A9Q9AHR8_9PEZI|nr:putative six-hairpin glycosidase superfamily [Septoria linicola]USW49310.1 Putative six-hairpin glycosidase superfamily [Septoria linicola]